MIKVNAKVSEISRIKSVVVKGNLRILNQKENKVFRSEKVNVESVFESYSVRYKGDKRALSDSANARLNARLEPFPTNEQMLGMCIEDIKKILFDQMDKNLMD